MSYTSLYYIYGNNYIYFSKNWTDVTHWVCLVYGSGTTERSTTTEVSVYEFSSCLQRPAFRETNCHLNINKLTLLPEGDGNPVHFSLSSADRGTFHQTVEVSVLKLRALNLSMFIHWGLHLSLLRSWHLHCCMLRSWHLQCNMLSSWHLHCNLLPSVYRNLMWLLLFVTSFALVCNTQGTNRFMMQRKPSHKPWQLLQSVHQWYFICLFLVTRVKPEI